jgi:IclR family transcriptional regulator, acetate operon repressor
MSADASGLTSVDRALQILELLGEHRAVRVMDVADHLGVARSTAHRLLTALLNRQFVVQDAAKVYHRGPAFAAAGFGVERVSTLRAAVRPHLEGLAGRVDETCHLVVLEGNGARFIDAVESGQILRVGSRIGMLLPAHTTAAGKALLAELSSPDFFALYPRGLPGMRAELAKRTTLQRELSVVRRRGWATNFDESEKGVTAVAVTVKGPGGLAVGSIAIACPTARCAPSRVEALVECVQDAARAAEAALAPPSATPAPAPPIPR